MAKKRSRPASAPAAEDPFDEIVNNPPPIRPPQKKLEKCPVGTWPDVVPVLAASDFCKGGMRCRARRCLLGWLEEFFDFDTVYATPCRNVAYTTLRTLVQEKSHHTSVNEFNDDPEVTEEELARTWRDMLVALGYEVD